MLNSISNDKQVLETHEYIYFAHLTTSRVTALELSDYKPRHMLR